MKEIYDKIEKHLQTPPDKRNEKWWDVYVELKKQEKEELLLKKYRDKRK